MVKTQSRKYYEILDDACVSDKVACTSRKLSASDDSDVPPLMTQVVAGNYLQTSTETTNRESPP